MDSHVFQELVGHLDTFPMAFSRPENEAAVALLKKLFTAEEAQLAVHLPIFMGDDPIRIQTIAHKMKKNAGYVKEILEPMVKKGLVYVIGEGEEARYSLLPFVPGILEFNVEKIDAELVRLLGKLRGKRGGDEVKTEIPLTRIIPVERSLDAETTVHPYESVVEAIKNSTSLCLMDCMCRTATKQVGQDCGRPIETCLYMNAYADYLIRIGKGRRVNVKEAIEVLTQAEDAGLVHLANNARELFGICSCCGCCCMGLQGLTKMKDPNAVSKSEFRLIVNSDLCTGCEICIERCWIDVLRLENDRITADLDRCLGCGACAYTCPTGALRLERKTPDEEQPLAADFGEMLTKMGWR
jgi:electron transport complex protein RnfB